MPFQLWWRSFIILPPKSLNLNPLSHLPWTAVIPPHDPETTRQWFPCSTDQISPFSYKWVPITLLIHQRFLPVPFLWSDPLCQTPPRGPFRDSLLLDNVPFITILSSNIQSPRKSPLIILTQIHLLAFLIDCEVFGLWKCVFIGFLESKGSPLNLLHISENLALTVANFLYKYLLIG